MIYHFHNRLASTAPVNVTIDKITATSLIVSWYNPVEPKGKLDKFHIYIDNKTVREYSIISGEIGPYTQKLINLPPSTTATIQVLKKRIVHLIFN